MIIHSQTIPSAFIRQDTRITDADSFVNVASQQRVRQNHNMLLARRIRKNLMSLAFGSEDSVFGQTFTFVSPLSAGDGSPFLSIPLTVTPLVKELVVVLRARRVSAGNVTLYAWCSESRQDEEIDTSIAVAVTSATEAKHTLTVPVARAASNNPRQVAGSGLSLNIVADGYTEGADLDDGTVTDARLDGVEAVIAGDYVGYAAYVPGNSSILPRRIVRHETAWIGVQPAWNIKPAVGDTIAVVATAEIEAFTMNVYEEKITAFADEAATQRV
jgi:hypothetical protein